MNWNDFKARIQDLVSMEIHAVFLTIAGVTLSLTGHKDEGMMVLGGAMALFKGQQK